MERGQLHPYRGIMPTVDETAFIAPGAHLIGDVVIGARSSVWFNCVLRGDVHFIRVGEGSNIQDGTVLHVTNAGDAVVIGNDVLVGHNCMLHGCEIQDGAFVGMSATVLDGAVVETGGMVAAGAMVPPGKVVRSGEMWGGSPAKLMRELREGDQRMMKFGAPHYAEMAAEYLEMQKAAEGK